MPILDHFGWLAPHYDRFASPRSYEEWAGRLGLPADGWLIDIGGGTGRAAAALRPGVSGAVVVDESMAMLSQAKEKQGLYVVCALAEHLPFAGNSVGRIIMVDALHHLGDQNRSAAELLRILKPGGRLLVEEPDITVFLVKLIALAEKILLMRSHFLSPQAIVRLFAGPNRKVDLEKEDGNAWISVQDQAASSK